MNEATHKSLAFAERVGGAWKETGGSDCKAYQRSFLCRQAFGAYHTAISYWILRENKCFSDSVALSRNLLERIANSICGAKSPTLAVELIANELSEKIRHAKLWNPSPGLSAELQQAVVEHKKILPVFLALIKKTKTPDWKFHRRFEQAGLGEFYRSAYFDFSRYAHAGYEVPRPGKRSHQSKAPDFIALAAPVITAANYHALDCRCPTHGECSVCNEGMALLQGFSSHTLGSKNPGFGSKSQKT